MRFSQPELSASECTLIGREGLVWIFGVGGRHPKLKLQKFCRLLRHVASHEFSAGPKQLLSHDSLSHLVASQSLAKAHTIRNPKRPHEFMIKKHRPARSLLTPKEIDFFLKLRDRG